MLLNLRKVEPFQCSFWLGNKNQDVQREASRALCLWNNYEEREDFPNIENDYVLKISMASHYMIS